MSTNTVNGTVQLGNGDNGSAIDGSSERSNVAATPAAPPTLPPAASPIFSPALSANLSATLSPALPPKQSPAVPTTRPPTHPPTVPPAGSATVSSADSHTVSSTHSQRQNRVTQFSSSSSTMNAPNQLLYQRLSVVNGGTSTSIRARNPNRMRTGVANGVLAQFTATQLMRLRPTSIERAILPHQTIPGTPTLCITRSEKSRAFKLTWDIVSRNEGAAEIVSYEVFMHGRKYKPDFWKKVGTVRAVGLPMGCTIRNVKPTKLYCLAIRSVDINGRLGPMSPPQFMNLVTF